MTTLKKSNKAERSNRDQGMFDFGGDLASGTQQRSPLQFRPSTRSTARRLLVLLRRGPVRRVDRFRHRSARAKLVADCWCASFVVKKDEEQPPVTESVLRKLINGQHVDESVISLIEEASDQYRFLHLHIAFPDVFTVPASADDADNAVCGWSGGFDVVLGNPPWERVKLQEEWFAARRPRHRKGPERRCTQTKSITALQESDPALLDAWNAASRQAEGESALLRSSWPLPAGRPRRRQHLRGVHRADARRNVRNRADRGRRPHRHRRR